MLQKSPDELQELCCFSFVIRLFKHVVQIIQFSPC